MNNKKIVALLINTSSYPKIGGVENSLNFMATHLKNKGIEARIVSFSSECSEKKTIKYNGIDIDIYPMRFESNIISKLWPRRALLKSANYWLPKIIDEINPEIIISRATIISHCLINRCTVKKIVTIFPTTTKLNRLGLLKSKNQKSAFKKIVFICRVWLDYFLMRRIERNVIEHSHNVVFSKLMRNEIQKIDLKHCVSVIVPGIDRTIFNIEHYSDVEPKKDYLLYVGRISVTKNIYDLLEEYKMSNKQYNLKIVGNGEEIDGVRNYIQKYNLGGTVELIGTKHNNELAELYYHARATILPTRVETFGQVIIESISMGTPVVAYSSEVKGVRNAVSEILDVNTGVLIKNIELGNMAQALNYVFKEIKYSQSNIECIEHSSRYSWDNFVESLVNVVKN